MDVNHVITLVPENEVLESTSEKDSNRTQCMQSSPNTGTSPEKDSPLTSSTPEFKDARVSPEKKSSIPCSSSPKFNNGVASPENHSTNLVSTTSLRKASDTANSTGKNSHNVRLTQSAPTPVSPVENNAENKTPNITKENKKSIKAKRKLLGGSLLKRKQKNAPLPSISVSLPNLDDLDTEECITPVLRREYSFTVSYLCSAVVNPPLKSKHVKECYKQYQKEMAKTKLPNNNGLLGNVLQLQIVTDEGVTMADLRNPNSFRREFPIETVDMFVAHPESEDCFAFSTKVDGTSKQKYHLFVKAKEPISEINEAFDLLHQTQISMGIALFS